jgi:hypothetical protein
MNLLKAAWKRGEVIEWRVRGSEAPWMLEPSEWDEQLYEYREYHPLLPPPRELSAAQQRAVELGRSLIEARRAMDQAAIAAETFTKALPKRKWWRFWR